MPRAACSSKPLNTDHLVVFIGARTLRIRDEKGALARARTFLVLGLPLNGR